MPKKKKTESAEAYDFIGLDELCQIVGGQQTPIHKATAYRMIAAGRLPKPVPISRGTVRWLRWEIEEALKNAAASRDQSEKLHRAFSLLVRNTDPEPMLDFIEKHGLPEIVGSSFATYLRRILFQNEILKSKVKCLSSEDSVQESRS